MFARFATLALAACAASSTDAFGQVYYGGYNPGPDYNAMINQSMANLNNIVKQAEQRGQQAVQQAMNDPRCKAMYQQHQQQGGRLSYQQFAYEYARTGGFTPEGKAMPSMSSRATRPKRNRPLIIGRQPNASGVKPSINGSRGISVIKTKQATS